MTEAPRYDVIQKHIRPEPGTDYADNEYEDDVQICLGTEVQGGCFVGRGTWLNNVIVYPYTRIGRYCSIARGAALGAPNHPIHALSTAVSFPSVNATMKFYPAEIGHDVWIGANATVLANVKVGHGAIVGAGAVVTKDVRPYAIVVGQPAREIRRRFPDGLCEALLESRWWELPNAVLVGLPAPDLPQTLRLILDLRDETRGDPELHRRLEARLAARDDEREPEPVPDEASRRAEILEAELAEARERIEALQTVIDATVANLTWRGLDRRAFQAHIAQAGRSIPDAGPAAIRHGVLLRGARQVLGLPDEGGSRPEMD